MNYTEQQLTAAVVSSKLRPTLAPLGSAAPASMLSLIEKCWDDNPQNRPSFDDIIIELGTMLDHRNKATEENPGLGKSSIAHDNLFVGAGNNNLAYKKSIDWSTEGERLSKRASLAVHSSLRIWCDSSNSMAYLPVLSWGSFATCGNRETMEDTHFLMPHFCNEKDVHLFGIFDGHRGAAAAEFSAKALPSYLKSIGSTSSPADALFEAFVSTDEAFRNALDTNRKPSGVIQKDWHPGQFYVGLDIPFL